MPVIFPQHTTSRQPFSISYSGENRADDHTIDVDALAPALIAFGRLIKEANAEVNGKNSTAKVLVVSDFEHKCFNINFEAIINLASQAQGVLGGVDAKSAKEILEWIGIAKGVGLAGYSLFKFLKWMKGQKVESANDIGGDKIEVKLDRSNNNTIVINRNVYNLYENPKAMKAVRDTLSPLGLDGINEADIRDESGSIEKINMQDADEIIASCNTSINSESADATEVEPVTAWLSPYSPVLDGKSEKWRFKYGKEHIYVDISDTDIAQSAVVRGGVMVDDAYHVQMEVSTPHDKNGKAGKSSYKILKVIKFVPGNPASQGDLFN